jgi:hypothetical protein
MLQDLPGASFEHVDAAGAVTSISLPKGFADTQDATAPLFMIDPDGTAWALGSTDLAEVPPGATKATLIPLGQLPDNAVAEGFRPPELRQIHSPVTLASDGAGHVALALDATSAVRVYSSRDGHFSDLQLPDGTDALSLSYFHDGSLAIGLGSYTGDKANKAVVAAPDGSLSQPIDVGDSSIVNPYSDTAVLFGGFYPTILNIDHKTQAITLPPGLKPEPLLGGVQVGQNGTLIVPTATGITFLNGVADAVATSTYAYPPTDEQCGPPGGQLSAPADSSAVSNGGSSAGQPTACPGVKIPARVDVGRDGAVWLLDDQQGPQTTQLTLATLNK